MAMLQISALEYGTCHKLLVDKLIYFWNHLWSILEK
jgi:hypothetical protein